MLTCNICSASCKNVNAFIFHLRFHSTVSKFKCPLPLCCVVCSSRLKLQSHIYRYHLNKQIPREHGHQSLKCVVESCGKSFLTLKLLIKHLRIHIDNGISVQCPILACGKTFVNKSTFSSHLSRNHYRAEQIRLSSAPNVPETSCLQDSVEETTHVVPRLDVELPRTTSNPTCSALLLEKNVQLFFLKLQSLLLVPTSTVNLIVNEIRNLLSLNNVIFEEKLQNLLPENFERKDQVLELFRDTDIERLLSNLRSNYGRQLTYERQFDFIEPIVKTVPLIPSGIVKKYCYVSVADSLHSVLSKKSVHFQLSQCLPHTPNVVADIKDGSLYKRIASDNTVALLLYTDEFEVCNPIGSARNKYKLVAFYYIIVNLYPWYRSKVNDIQLVLLAKSIDFKKHKTAFLDPLLTELKILENTGVQCGGLNFKFRILGIAGDNLGSNDIGGFTTHFATTTRFCRFCAVPLSEYFNNFNCYELRSPDSYTRALSPSTSEQTSQGIKANSLFNSLSYFHVCNPGLPPCAAHDLLEGIVKADLSIYLSSLVAQQFFSYKELNLALSNFKFKGVDAKNKPCALVEGKNIIGKACQIWCLLQFLPLLLSEFRIDEEAVAWLCLIKLHNLCSYAFAPRLSNNQIAIFSYIVEDYIHSRRLGFPEYPLKPKHHLIEHYPYLFHTFGPLVQVWTLRFESKHQYFKRLICRASNFVNITALLGQKHQMLQTYLREMDSDVQEMELKEYMDVYFSNLSQPLQDALSNSGYENFSIIKTTNTVVYRNTEFKNGMIVTFKNDCNNSFGLIERIIIDPTSTRISFLVQCLNDHPEQGYFTVKKTTCYKFVLYDELTSDPFNLYLVPGKLVVVPPTVPVDLGM